MPRAGRSLEELVQGLERVLAKTPVEITSPDHIMGRNSGEMREVDVSLRSQVGSVNILVIIECRDRKRGQDVTWIEQLASKRKDVGADRAIAVSAKGFSKGAWSLAQAEHIDLRSFEEVDEDAVFSWLELQTIEHRVRRVEVIRVGIETAEEPSGITPAEVFAAVERIRRDGGPYQDDKIFVRKADTNLVSIDDIWITTPNLGVSFDEAMPDLRPRERERRTLNIAFDPPQFCVGTAVGLYDITSLAIDGNFYYDEKSIPISRLYAYVSASGTITENAEATIEHEGERIVLGLHATPGGPMLAASVRSTGNYPIGGMDITFDVVGAEDEGD
jgi:Restriction endonuclease